MFSTLFSFGFGIGMGYVLNKYSEDIRSLFVLFKRTSKESTSNEWVKNASAGLKMCQLAMNVGWVRVEQYLRQSCVLRNGVYHISFVIHSRLYTIVVKPPQGPWVKQDIDIYGLTLDENGEINLEKKFELDAYIRGLQSHIELTPKLLGESAGLSFVYPDGEIKEFKANEPIQITDV
jgi:hypothetical protein